MMSPFHPAYGLPDPFRMEVLRYAEDHGVPAAAKVYAVHFSTIYNWRKAFKSLQEGAEA